jgi:fused signal recognition particle receptor
MSSPSESSQPTSLLGALSKATSQFAGWWHQVFTHSEARDAERLSLIDTLEELLLKADFGWVLTERLLQQLLQQPDWQTESTCLACLKRELLSLFPIESLDSQPTREIILIAGVNGSGKTTSLAKLAYFYQQQGKRVRIAAADTFRAAADQQLTIWAERVGVPVESLGLKADPSAVVVKGIQAWEAEQEDVLLIDTAGRLHNQANLMAELEKIRKTVTKFQPVGVQVSVLLVLEALVGQNALQQASIFGSSLEGLNGFILTKLDSSAKAGMVFQLAHQLGLAPKWVATGEQLTDLTPFNTSAFIDGLLSI